MINIRYYFNVWLKKYLNKKEWSENLQEESEECEYACENKMDSIYWCWNCKYSDCYIHN
jgi:hypothetical protein